MSKNCFIYETLNDVKTMSVQKTKDGFMHLSGVFGVCNTRNNNGRVYEAGNYGKMVESMKERIKKAPIPGELEHPATMNITLENISHRIDSIDIDENGVVSGEITLLDTPKGKIAQAIVEGGLPLFISSRATGNVDQKSGVVTLEMLQTYDLVGSPGFSQAELHLNENQVAESICENLCVIMENNNNEDDSVNEVYNTVSIFSPETQAILQYIALIIAGIPVTALVTGAIYHGLIEPVKDWIDKKSTDRKLNIIKEKLMETEDFIAWTNNKKRSLKDLIPILRYALDQDEIKYLEKASNNIWNEYKNKNENQNNENITDMEMKEILEKLEELENKVNVLEEVNATLQDENKSLREVVEAAPKFDLKKLADGIQNWIVEEYSPMVQNWIVEEFANNFKGEVVSEAVEVSNDNFVNEMAPKIQNWIVEEFSPEVEKWCCTELANGIQNWVVEEFSPEVENWMNESYSAKIAEQTANQVSEALVESKAAEKKENLNAIDETLKLLESIEVSKPTYSRKSSMINENVNEPKYIAEMPETVRPQYEMASQEIKESIARRAKLYNFFVEGAVEKFWENIDFNSIKPAKTIYEGLNTVEDERERNIRAQFRSWRSRK